jgi:short-subunit dehydrogenase
MVNGWKRLTCPEIVDEVMREVGPIDILVNNAGYTFAGSVEEATFAEIRAQFETNYFGAINLIKAVLPSMRTRRQGHILNVSSMAGFVTPGGIGIYGGSKLALESTSEALAHELRPFGINVTVIVPGAFRTQLGHSRRSAPSSIPDYLPQNQARNEFLSAYSDFAAWRPEQGGRCYSASRRSEDAATQIGHRSRRRRRGSDQASRDRS